MYKQSSYRLVGKKSHVTAMYKSLKQEKPFHVITMNTNESRRIASCKKYDICVCICT